MFTALLRGSQMFPSEQRCFGVVVQRDKQRTNDTRYCCHCALFSFEKEHNKRNQQQKYSNNSDNNFEGKKKNSDYFFSLNIMSSELKKEWAWTAGRPEDVIDVDTSDRQEDSDIDYIDEQLVQSEGESEQNDERKWLRFIVRVASRGKQSWPASSTLMARLTLFVALLACAMTAGAAEFYFGLFTLALMQTSASFVGLCALAHNFWTHSDNSLVALSRRAAFLAFMSAAMLVAMALFIGIPSLQFN
jgi:hypothetical protein